MYGKSGAMLPTASADHTRFSLRKGSTAAAWDTVKGIEWNRLYVAKFADFRNSCQELQGAAASADRSNKHFSPQCQYSRPPQSHDYDWWLRATLRSDSMIGVSARAGSAGL